MSTYIHNWLKLSDGTAATGMDATIVTDWIRVGAGGKLSEQFEWPAGPSGTFSVQFTNSDGLLNTYAAPATSYPSGLLVSSPTQPTGTADFALHSFDESLGEFARGKYVPSSGGSGVLPTATISF